MSKGQIVDTTYHLTALDCQFGDLLLTGMSQHDAFLVIRPHAARWGQNAIDSNASKLARKVSIRNGEVLAQATTNAIMDVSERKERLSEIGNEDIPGKHGPNRQPNIAAIAELNKMEHIYSDANITNIDNRTIEVVVSSEEAKVLTDRILQGEGTKEGK